MYVHLPDWILAFEHGKSNKAQVDAQAVVESDCVSGLIIRNTIVIASEWYIPSCSGDLQERECHLQNVGDQRE